MKLGKKRNPAPAQTERKLRAASLAADEARELFKRMREVVK